MEAPVEVVVPSVEGKMEGMEEQHHPDKPALTPPTSEDNDKREARQSSELSELESSDDEEEIEPDHYFEGGKIPVFKPTMDQFRSFRKFIDKIDKYGMKSGIVKVIPPKEWRNSLPDLTEAVKTIKVKNPITQEFAGQHGIYTQANIEKQRSYNLPEWKALTEEAHHQPPAKRGERRRAAAEAPARTRSTRAAVSTRATDDASPAPPRRGRPPKRRGKEIQMKQEDAEGREDDVEVPPTPKSPGKEDASEEKRPKRSRAKKEEQDDATPTKPKGRQPRSTASRRMTNRTAMADYVDEAAFEGFDYHLDNVEEFTIERCKELEDTYWKTINYGQPMYGADMPGSLFDDRTTSWNVAKLENLLDVLGTKVPGVNTAYLYLGMWKATFAWHLEDVDLYSINYIHFGAPKQWYSISQEDARRFEAAMKSIWPNDAKNCSQFLRHKTYLISPAQLEKQFNIKVNRLVHNEGEFVITYPYGYHSGYNLGYNCAESVNFANEAWLSYGRIAKKCECESDSVWVDVNEIERKLRGEPTPEYYEETDDEDEEMTEHLPSPPPSVASKSKGKPGRKPGNKRKRAAEEPKEAPKPKKVKRIRIRIKIPGRGMPCVLCPNDVDYDELLPTDNGLKAHRLCADYTPETYISSKPGEVVCNVANIGKDRLDLKCNYCRSKRGAVFQCSQKKCTRAFHATCAAAAGVQVDLGPMPTFDEEGTEYFYDGYDFRCRFHRPKKRNVKKVTADTLENDRFIMDYAKALKPKDVVQFQYLDAEMYQIYGGLVIENRPGEATLLVEVLPDGDRVEVEWKYLLHLDPAESERPKPSANAKPLPEHLKESDSSLAITNRTDGVPEMGDPFHDPNSEQKWAEFNTAPEVTQKVHKTDLTRPHKLWHYLGKTSTEARAQYTDDIRKPVHNPKSNFLETVKPPPPPMPVLPRYPYNVPPYSIKPMPMAPRTPVQQQFTGAMEKPYQYKPKVQVNTYRSPVSHYNPDTRKNPNSPVAHQPNVSYDHRSPGSQQGHTHHIPNMNPHQPHRPSHSFHHYQPPQNHTHVWKVTPTQGPSTSGPLLHGINQYATAHQPLPPYPYQTQPSPHSAAPYPSYAQPQTPGSGRRPSLYGPPVQHPSASHAQTPPNRGAPHAHIMSKPTGTSNSNSSMYATDHPSSSVCTTQPSPLPQFDYLAYVTKYPYLKNAFLRRAKTYISPYSPDGGFTPEWKARLGGAMAQTQHHPHTQPHGQHQPRQNISITPKPTPPPLLPNGRPPQGPHSQTVNYHTSQPPTNTPSNPIRHRPAPQFQSADAFQRDVAASASAPSTHDSGMPKWESMMRQLAASPAPAPQSQGQNAQLPALARNPPLMPVAKGKGVSTPQQPQAQQQPQGLGDPIDPRLMGNAPPVSIGGAAGGDNDLPPRPTYSPISDEERPGTTATAPAPIPVQAKMQ